MFTMTTQLKISYKAILIRSAVIVLYYITYKLLVLSTMFSTVRLMYFVKRLKHFQMALYFKSLHN